MSNSDFVLPFAGANVNRTLLRAALVKRVIYPLEDGEDATTFVANVSGSVPLALANAAGAIFFLDPNDNSSPHDGVAVLRTFDGYRYKISNMTMPDSVLGPLGLETPPADPDIGDTYLTGDAPDAEWASNPNQFAVYTIREWAFIEPRIGRPFYVEGAGHYYLDENGDFIPTFAPDTASIRDTSLLGGSRFYIVENSTLNAPPGAPGAGIYWRVAGAPTGAWAGHANEVATKYPGDASWTFFPLSAGTTIYDKAQKAMLSYDGAAWVPQGGAIQFAGTTGWKTPPTSTTGGSGSFAMVSAGVLQNATLGTAYRKDISAVATLTVPAGRRIRFVYDFVTDTSRNTAFALYRDSEFIALETAGYVNRGGWTIQNLFFEITTSDSSAHTYYVVEQQIAGNAAQDPLRSRLAWEIFI